jgi:hypothetical protein
MISTMTNTQPVIFFRFSLVFILGGVLGGSILYCLNDFIVGQPVAFHSIQRFQLSKQPEHVRNSCWQCIQPNWRRHFVFANSSTGHLDVCPDSNSWPAGAWTHPVILAGSVQAAAGGTNQAQPLKFAKPAALGEPAVLPATLMAQHAIAANQRSGDCRKAKLLVYRAVHR